MSNDPKADMVYAILAIDVCTGRTLGGDLTTLPDYARSAG